MLLLIYIDLSMGLGGASARYILNKCEGATVREATPAAIPMLQ
jgi:hypothetical protein